MISLGQRRWQALFPSIAMRQPRRSALTGRCAIRWTRSPIVILPWNFCCSIALCDASVTPCRRAGALGIGSIRLYPPFRCLFHGFVDHATEAQSRCRRACPRQARADQRQPDHAPDRAERSAAHLWQGHAGRQGTCFRCSGKLADRPCRHDGHDARS